MTPWKFWAPLHEVKHKNLFNRLYQNISWVYILGAWCYNSTTDRIKVNL